MGIYHLVANEAKKEFIDPGKVGGGSIKQGFVLNCGTLVLWLMANGWYGDDVRVYKDVSDDYFEIEDSCNDITLKSIEEFNKVWPNHQIEVCKD